MPEWIKRTIQRARREGVDSAVNWELTHATKAQRDGFDQYLISINHPSVYEPGSQEYRVKRFVRERINKRKRNASRTVHAVSKTRRRVVGRKASRRAKRDSARKNVASKRRATTTAKKVRSVVKARKAPVKRVAKRAGKKSSRVLKGNRNPTPAVLAIVNRTSSKARVNRREFAGEYRRDTPLYFPEGTPSCLSKLGKRLKVETDRATVRPTGNDVWLCRDLQGQLYVGTRRKDSVIYGGPAENFGRVKRVDYEDVKKHLGYNS